MYIRGAIGSLLIAPFCVFAGNSKPPGKLIPTKPISCFAPKLLAEQALALPTTGKAEKSVSFLEMNKIEESK